ncbi:MAG: response regulator transcription factor [Acidimicrobiia bacterium]
MAVRVLIVDDQPPFRDAARMVVEMTHGFEVIGEAESGEEGVELAATLRPDLVLMDVYLPGIDGLEATRQITSAESPTRVLVMSTHESDEFAKAAMEAGAIAFVSKSQFGIDELASAWAQVADAG